MSPSSNNQNCVWFYLFIFDVCVEIVHLSDWESDSHVMSEIKL